MTAPDWGRREDAGRWMPSYPARTFGALLIAILTVGAVGAFRMSYVWSDTQRGALGAYLKSTAVTAVGAGDFQFSRRGTTLRREGRALTYAEVTADLRDTVYAGQSLRDLASPPLLAGLIALVVGLFLAVPADIAAARARRHGKRLKGPQMLDAAEFNQEVRGDGLAITQEGAPSVAIERRSEASHVLILGDTGTGKSSLIRQFLKQISARGETAIVYDPAREYLPQFYQEARGDQILNPLDARCPYWTPADEVRQDEEALTLAAALFPTRHGQNAFFEEAPRRIFAHLLTRRPSADTLAGWLRNGDDLDHLLADTPYAHMIEAKAPAQRSGVLAALNMQADTLSLLPSVRDGHGLWSAADWAEHRHGWLFFTSGPDTRERQIPLMTLWLDMLILRLMQSPNPQHKKTWIVIDELASLRTLPQLATALTESRKANVPMILGFQARSQMEALYGKTAEAMLSQPATKIILRTSEPNSAKWLSDTIGQVEVERIELSRSAGGKRSRTESLRRAPEPLVLPSEIQIQPDRSGLLKVGALVTRVRFPYLTLPPIASAFEPRRRVERAHMHSTLPVPSEPAAPFISLN